MGRLNRLLGLKTLRQQLRFWISVMLVMFTILITISFYFIGLNHAKKTALNNMEETISVQNIYIDKWFEERAANIRNLANMHSSKSLDTERIGYNLKFALESINEFDTLHFIDTNGKIIITTVEDNNVTDLSDREYFKEAMKGNEFTTDVLIGRGSQRFIIVFSSPVFDYQNKVIGTVIGSVSLKSIDQIVDNIEVSYGKDIYIANREGYMITESRFIEELLEKGIVKETARMNIKLDNGIYEKALENGVQKASYIDYRGEEVYGTYRWTNNGQWLIISEIDKKVLLQGVYNQLYSVIGSLLFIFTISIFITLKFTKKIEEPIQHLLKGTAIIQDGNYTHRIEDEAITSGPKELMILCDAFNEMTVTIDSHMRFVQESEQRYRALLYHNPDIVFSLNNDGVIHEINSACTQLLGYEIDEVIGKSFVPFVAPENLDKTMNYFTKILQGEAHNFDSFILKKDGGKGEFNITLFPIMIKEAVAGVYGIGKDVTQQKLADATLKEYARKLEQSNKDLQQFAYVASHDLQEPLRMVTSYLQLFERRYKGKIDEDANEFIYYAVDGAKRMQKLINDLLAYSRVNTKENEFKFVNSEVILKKVLQNLEFRIKEKGVQITFESLPVVMGDETQLMQLFQNIIVNGIKFNDKESPQIHISVHKSGTRWVFGIKDNGIGIPPQHQERIFTIFQRLHTRDEYEGTGIGLAICKRIVEKHGGLIWFESQEQEGTTFYFTIPITGGRKNE